MSAKFYKVEDVHNQFSAIKNSLLLNGKPEIYVDFVSDIESSIKANVNKIDSTIQTSYWEGYSDIFDEVLNSKEKTRCFNCKKGSAIKHPYCPKCGCKMLNVK